LHAGNGHGIVPVVGRGDGDGVDLLQLENLAKVLVRCRSVSQCLLGAVGKLVQDGAIHIANMGYPSRILIPLQSGEVRIGARVEADDGKVEAIVGAHDLAVAFGGRTNCQTCGSNSKRVEKLTSSNQFASPFERQQCRLSNSG
jgi:hypothetical protein